MDCEDVCAIGGMILIVALAIGFLLFMVYSGIEIGRKDIMEKCDKIGEFTVRDYTYKCELEEV